MVLAQMSFIMLFMTAAYIVIVTFKLSHQILLFLNVYLNGICLLIITEQLRVKWPSSSSMAVQ